MILIPVKGFTTAKQRLASLLSPVERSVFARAMLEDVLRALASCSGASPVAIITGDAGAQQVALRFGFDLIHDSDAAGETEAVAMATRVCIGRGVASVLVLPGDIPLVESREVKAVTSALSGPPDAPGVVLVPAHDGRGTNAALLRPPGLFELRFGNDSFEPHLMAARKSGQACEVLHLPGIGLDVDNAADVVQLLRAGTRTESQELLHSWNVPQRLKSLAGREHPGAWSVTP